MQRPVFSTRTSEILACSAIAVASFVVSAIILRHGVGGSPDSWSYWEGSVSLIEKHSYSYLSGSPIIFWPPLFSLFLALFQSGLSQTGHTLALAMSVCSGLTAFAWGLYVLKFFPGEDGSRNSLACGASLLFVLCFVPLCCLSLLSNSLVLFFVGLLFYRLARLDEGEAFWRGYGGPMVLGLILCGCMLAHNSSLVFVAATALAVVYVAGSSVRRGMAGAGIVCLISIGPWLFVRHWLGQAGSHGITGGAYSVAETFWQLLYGVGVLLASTSSTLIQALIGAAILSAGAAVVVRRPRSGIEARRRLCSGSAILALAGFFLLFNLTAVGDKIGGRFVWFFPLAIVPPLMSCVSKKLPLLMALILVSAGVSGARIYTRSWHAIVPPLDSQAKRETARFIHNEYFLTSETNPVVPAGKVRVIPPVFPWGERYWPDSLTNAVAELVNSPGDLTR